MTTEPLRQLASEFPLVPQVCIELEDAVAELYRAHGWCDLPEASLGDLVMQLRVLLYQPPPLRPLPLSSADLIERSLARSARLLLEHVGIGSPAMSVYLEVLIPFALRASLVRHRLAETPEQRAALVASVNEIRKAGIFREPAEHPPQYSWEQIVGLV